jgi:hypothetical protein
MNSFANCGLLFWQGPVGSFTRPPSFLEAGSEYGASAPIAFQNICNRNEKSNFAYGHFYVTTGKDKAARYAMRASAGSELLMFIESGLQVLRALEAGTCLELQSRYRDLISYIERPNRPVVLELRGISPVRLTDDNGDVADLSCWEELLSLQPGLIVEPAFRVAHVQPVDIVAVHELNTTSSDGPMFAQAISVADWLQENVRGVIRHQ